MQSLHQAIANTKYQGCKPLLVVLTARDDCPNSKAFEPKLAKIKKALDGKVTIIHLHGNSGNYDSNSGEVKEALDILKWGDGSHHYPCGALYAQGAEKYHLQKDNELAHNVSAQSLGEDIAKAAFISNFDRKALLTDLQSDACDLLKENELGINFVKYAPRRYIESKGDEIDVSQRVAALYAFMTPTLIEAVQPKIGTHIDGNLDKGTVRLELPSFLSDDVKRDVESLARNLADYGVNYPGSEHYRTRTHP